MLNKSQWVFIHIPKTAGTAFTNAIAPIFGQQYDRPWLTYHLFLKKKHPERYTFLAGHIFFSMIRHLLPKHVQYMTLLRDPIDRAYSHWEHIRRRDDHYFHTTVQKMTFSEFMRHPGMSPLISNFHARYIAIPGIPPKSIGPVEYQKYYELKPMSTDYLFERTLAILDTFVMVGIQEYLPESVRQACNIMGIEAPDISQRVTPNYRGIISDQDLDYLEHINEIDIALYEEFRARFENETIPGNYHPRIKARELGSSL